MRRCIPAAAVLLAFLVTFGCTKATGTAGFSWPQWRGPFQNGPFPHLPGSQHKAGLGGVIPYLPLQPIHRLPRLGPPAGPEPARPLPDLAVGIRPAILG